MNILILSWRGLGHPYAGGAEIVTHEHAKTWVRAGHSVTLFTSGFENAPSNEYIDGVKFLRSGGQLGGVHLSAAVWYLFGRHQKFDLIIDHFHYIPFLTPLYARTKILAFIHEVASDVWYLNKMPAPYNFIKDLLGPTVEKYIISKLYKNIHFMTVSKSTKEDLMEMGLGSNAISIIHNGINTPEAAGRYNKETKPTALFLGTLSKDKGIEEAIKVFSELYKRDESWKFWIVGRGEKEYLVKIKKSVMDLGIKNVTKYWGYVSDAKKYELLAKSHILVNTSYHEGWGLVNIEANSVSTPVAGYNTKGVKDSVINGVTGILTDWGNYSGLASEVSKLILDSKRYESMQKKAFRRSKNFSWEKSSEESLKLIESI